jgi:hypothetical protein
VFTVPSGYKIGNKTLGSHTLIQGLGFQGGNNASGAAQILLRAAIAALLNAAHPDVDYPLTIDTIITQTNAALAGNRTAMLALAQTLDMYNNDGCPLN